MDAELAVGNEHSIYGSRCARTHVKGTMDAMESRTAGGIEAETQSCSVRKIPYGQSETAYLGLSRVCTKHEEAAGATRAGDVLRWS